jgi:hypothetical protein
MRGDGSLHLLAADSGSALTELLRKLRLFSLALRQLRRTQLRIPAKADSDSD